MVGPPIRAAFRDDKPSRAAEAFAANLGGSVAELRRIDTPKGVYVAGTKHEPGRRALELLPAALAAIAKAIPFRRAMRCFLHPEPVPIPSPQGYVEALRHAHVLAVPHERAELMKQRLVEAAKRAGGSWEALSRAAKAGDTSAVLALRRAMRAATRNAEERR